MVIQFWTGFSKRVNSTKVPDTDATRTLTGNLKEPCSLLNPVFKIMRLSNDEHPQIYSYACIPAFQRYYFVNDWKWDDGVWQCTLTVDTLGTWRTRIGALEEYVIRHDSDSDFNGGISDSMYPATTDFSTETTAFPNPFVESLTQGTYVVGIINGDSYSTVGAVTYYAMTPGEFMNMKEYLYSDNNLLTMGIIDSDGNLVIEDISKELFRALYNPFQYIASCIWFPIAKEEIAGQQYNRIKLGWWEYPISAKIISGQTKVFTETASVPVHPQSTRGKYLNYAPYTKHILYGKFGSFPLNTSIIEIGDDILIYYIVDLISGKCNVRFYSCTNMGSASEERKELGTTEFLIGVPIQLAQISTDYLGTLVTGLETAQDAGVGMAIGALAGGIGGTAVAPIGGTAIGAPAGAIVGGLISAGRGIYNTINTAMPQLQTSGVNGSFVGGLISTVMISTFFVITDEDIHHKGRLLCEVRTINTLSGYIECADGDISIPCTLPEMQTISNHLTSGFYWE